MSDPKPLDVLHPEITEEDEEEEKTEVTVLLEQVREETKLATESCRNKARGARQLERLARQSTPSLPAVKPKG